MTLAKPINKHRLYPCPRDTFEQYVEGVKDTTFAAYLRTCRSTDGPRHARGL